MLSMLGLSVLLQGQARIPGRIWISAKVSHNLILIQTQPNYPEEAREKHIHGSVVMRAGISKEGLVEYLKVQSGDPTLTVAATDAVKKWKYKPLVLNGQTLPFETQVTVIFKLPIK